MLIEGAAYVTLRVGSRNIKSKILITPDMTGFIIREYCMRLWQPPY